MTIQTYRQILEQGVSVWNKWREDNPEIFPNLSRMDFSKTKLDGVNFSNTFLSESNFWLASLENACLINAVLTDTNLSNTNLRNADLQNVRLKKAHLFRTNLESASLLNADLRGAIFINSNLNNTDISFAICYDTHFADVDFSKISGLETIEHRGRSIIGIGSLLRSGKLPEQFLRGCGIPKEVIENLPYIIEIPAIEYYSCFISYSTADEDFARLLKDTLYGAGINCWYAPEQILPGQRIDDEIDYGIRYWDKVLFVCSKSSLTEKWWVDFEKDKALKKERDLQRERGQNVGILIPLNLDGYLFSNEFDTDAHRSIFEMRLVADFVGWKNDMDKFNREVQKVIRALRTDGGRTPPPKSKL